MFPSLVTIYLELAAGLILLWPGLRAFWHERSNRVRLYFLLATLLLASSFLIDGVGRLLLYEQLLFTDRFFRVAEVLLLPAGLSIVYLGGIFPRRVQRWDWRSGRRERLLTLIAGLVLIAVGLGLLTLLDLHYVYDRLYDPVPGTYYGTLGPVYGLNRLFLPACLFMAAYEQRRFLSYHERDPRRVHSRYFILALLALGAVILLLCGLLLVYGGYENEFMALQAVAFVAFAFFLRNMLENLSVSYRANLLRNGVLLSLYAVALLPLFYVIDLLLVWMGPEQSLFTAFVLCILFVIFFLSGRALRPWISRLIFKEQARIEDHIAHFNQSILRLGASGEANIARQLSGFIDEIFAPRLFALYFPGESTDDENDQTPAMTENQTPRDLDKANTKTDAATNGHANADANADSHAGPPASGTQQLLQDKSFTRAADLQSIPPDRFPPDLLAFLGELRRRSHGQRGRDASEPGGLLADLLVRAEMVGDQSIIESLTALATSGAELILPFYDESTPSAGETGDSEAADAAPAAGDLPEAVLLVGLLSSGRPLDHDDANLMWLLRTPILLALKNQELLRDATVLKEKLEEENKRITRRLNQSLSSMSRDPERPGFVFQPGGGMAKVLSQAEIFAGQDSPVLITGETGTGKGEIARMMHGLSKREGRFVTVNCSAIPSDLIENELFGHTKGAYTGASDAQEGLVFRAEDGTLFLDEIGEMPPEGQTKLLRLVQHGEYEPIGSSETRKTTARFLFATNRDLELDAQAGRFRSDLYFRISTFEVQLPPLRERSDDLPLLIEHFLETARRNFHRPALQMTADARSTLMRYAWPGNVRELENLIFRTAVLSDSDVLDQDQLPVMFRDELDFNRKQVQLERMAQEQSRLEKELLLEALQKSGGNQRAAAKILNISRGSLQYRLKQHGLS
ncbi:MAG: sigma-54 dependent transcriptional regulator [bacterium]|nr:sigma-54 dependent transcriptional regulator [bacterium]